MKKYRIIDAHCHIYPDKIAEKASGSTGDFYGIKTTYDGKVSTLLGISVDAGIDHCVVQSVEQNPNRFLQSTGLSHSRSQLQTDI